MRVLLLTLAFVLAGRLAAPSAATAQYYTRPYVHAADGVVLGGSFTTAETGFDPISGGRDLGALVEVPIADGLRLRGEGAVGAWRYGADAYSGVPASRGQRYRLTASVIRSRFALTDRQRLSPYVGGGMGLYVYDVPYPADTTRWGVHGLAGLEFLLPTARSRWMLGGEIQLHVAGGPQRPGGSSASWLVGQASLLLKYRLP
jgi:hypothetical protein